MLSTTLNTNEIKNSLGTEQEFGRRSGPDSNGVEYALLTEAPNLKHRFSIKHTELGTGVDKRRRSLLRFEKQVAGQVDTTKSPSVLAYVVMDIPVGNLTAYTEAQNTLANLMSLLASTGADTTIKFDCSGNGATALVNGTY